MNSEEKDLSKKALRLLKLNDTKGLESIVDQLLLEDETYTIDKNLVFMQLVVTVRERIEPEKLARLLQRSTLMHPDNYFRRKLVIAEICRGKIFRNIKPAKTNCTVVSRIFIGELPYLKAFCSHYMQLGITNFVFIVNTTDYRDGRLMAFMEENGFPVEYIVYEGESITMRDAWNLKEREEKLSGEYSIFVDIDEYLLLRRDSSLADTFAILPEIPAEHIKLNWLVSCLDDSNAQLNRIGRQMNYGKSIAKTSAVNGFVNDHKITTFDDRPSHVAGSLIGLDLVHYLGRSVNDTLIKILISNNKQSAGKKKHFTQQISQPSLHPRLKFHAYVAKFSVDLEIPNYISERIDVGAEEEIIYSIVPKNVIDDIKESYYMYKDQLPAHLSNIFPFSSGVEETHLFLP